MAGKTDIEKGKGKGAAFAKWAKIDKAQRNMFIAVCLASVVLGVTIVSIIYFAKVISFNAKLMDEKSKVISDLSVVQSNIESIAEQVDSLADDENLEAVARARSADCETLLKSGVDVTDTSGEIEVARTCSSLRVIPDSLPSKENNEAMLASLNVLLAEKSSLSIEGLSLDDSVPKLTIAVSSDDEDSDDVDEDGVEHMNYSSDDEEGESGMLIESIGASVLANNTQSTIIRSLKTVENSIRNYDLISASFSWAGSQDEGGDTSSDPILEFNGAFRSYYTGTSDIVEKKKKVCADDNNEKCTGKKD